MIPGSANPLLLKSAAAAGGYQIERSLRFNSSDSGFCSRTPAVAGNRTVYTWSFWLKRSGLGEYHVFRATSDGSNYTEVYFSSNDKLNFQNVSGGTANTRFVTTQVFRDTSAWYHLVLSINGSTAAKLYVNGVEVTVFDTTVGPGSSNHQINNTVSHTIGSSASSSYANFYLADIHFIDGQALDYTSFTEVSATTGQLVPKAYTGTYTGNSFWLKFNDNSAATATTLGKDSFLLGNNWTPNNLSVTAGAGNDSLVDTPTSYGTDTSAGGEVRGNYATFNPTESSTSGTKTLTNGNLDVLLADANAARLTIPPIQGSGKYQWEITIGSKTATYYQMGLNLLSMVYATGDLHATFRSDGNLSNTLSGSWSGTGVSYTSGDVITVTYDNATNACAFYKNGVYSATFTVSGTPQASLNFGVFYGGSGNTNYTLNAGQRPFAYPVSGFKALCDTNLPAPVVAKPNTVFDAVPYTGSSGSQSITTNFSPDLVWVKTRNAVTDHEIYDIVRGAGVRLSSNNTLAENSLGANGLSSFNSNGFTVPSTANYGINGSGYTYAAWAWDAGSSTVTNTQGSITSQVRANASAGFSVVTYTGTGSGTNTVGHGLGAAPGLIIVKVRDASFGWRVYHSSLGATKILLLNSTSAEITDSQYWNNTSPTSNVFTAGIDPNSANNYVAYCFAPVAGYSSFGSYTGNGSADGPFVYTGFRPRWIMVKDSSSVTRWIIWDSARDTYNFMTTGLSPNLAVAEITGFDVDALSNGFKLRDGEGTLNQSSDTFIYAAFAESPFQYARAR